MAATMAATVSRSDILCELSVERLFEPPRRQWRGGGDPPHQQGHEHHGSHKNSAIMRCHYESPYEDGTHFCSFWG